MKEEDEITQLLAASDRGEVGAAARLHERVQDRLRKLAGACMAALPPGNTLQPTALVNEAWLRIAAKTPEQSRDRARFFATAARAMRDILVEQARSKGSKKRGGERDRECLELAEPSLNLPSISILDVNDVLAELETEDPRSAQLIDLRFFAGLSIEETAAALGVSSRTVDAQWQFARRWLYRRLRGGND